VKATEFEGDSGERILRIPKEGKWMGLATTSPQKLDALLHELAQRIACPKHGPQDLNGKQLTTEGPEGVPFTCCSRHQGLLKEALRKRTARKSSFKVLVNEG
jgi:hypothetical protein